MDLISIQHETQSIATKDLIQNLYLFMVQFKNHECVEKYYFDMYILKKQNMSHKITFKIILDKLGSNYNDYMFKNNEINEKIKTFLIQIYFQFIKLKIDQHINNISQLLCENQIKYIFSLITCFFGNGYLNNFKNYIYSDYKQYMKEIIHKIFEFNHVSYCIKYNFLYDLMESIGNKNKPFERLKKDLVNDFKNNKKMDHHFYHIMFIMKNETIFLFTDDQKMEILEIIKNKHFFNYRSVFSFYLAYYRKRKVVFMKFIEYTEHLLDGYHEDLNSITCNIRKNLFSMIKFIILYNKTSLKLYYIQQVTDFILKIYNHRLRVISKHYFIKLIYFYFENYSNIMKFLNNYINIEVKDMDNDLQFRINNRIYSIIDDLFVLTNRDKKKIRGMLCIT